MTSEYCRGVSYFGVTRYYKVGVRQIRIEISTWGRVVSKMAQKLTSFMEGPYEKSPGIS